MVCMTIFGSYYYDSKMEGNCINCGKTFALRKGGKGYHRTSIQANVKLKQVDKTIKDVIEEEYRVTLTPDMKKTRFLCPTCSWSLISMAKSRETRQEALQQLKKVGESHRYLAKKLRSPSITPRKTKRQRVVSPQKDKIQPAVASTSTSGTKKSQQRIGQTSTDVKRACNLLNARLYPRAIKILVKARVGFKKALFNYVAIAVREELIAYTKKKTSIFKGGKPLEELKNFQWNERYNEMKDSSPRITEILTAAVARPRMDTMFVERNVCCIMAQLLYSRMSSFCDLQEINSLQLWLAGCKRQAMIGLHHLNLCVGLRATRTAIDRIRKNHDQTVMKWKTDIADHLLLPSESEATIPYGSDHSLSPMSTESSPQVMSPRRPQALHQQVIERQLELLNLTNAAKPDEIRKDLGYSLVFDNVNQRVNVRHQTRDRKNKMFNMVQAYAAQDRVPSLNLSDEYPSPEDILKIPLEKYIPSDMDEVDLRAELTTIVSRILCEHVPDFMDLSDEVSHHIQHPYSMESAQKSIMVPLGVLNKDESKVADTIDIMDNYHKYVPVKPHGDPLTIILHADGLSCERCNDAQSARSNSASPWQQLQGLIPNIQEWHKRCILLQDVFDELYKGSSAREKGTLFHLKNYFGHRNVSQNVKECFNYDEEFLQFCTEGYVVLAAYHFIEESGMHVDTDPDDKVMYMEKIASQIVDFAFISAMPAVRSILGELENDEVHDYPYCVCKTEKSGELMVFCDNRKCQSGTWFHLHCLDMEENDIPEGKWFCSDVCKAGKGASIKKRTVDAFVDMKQIYTQRVMWRGLNQMARRDAIRENDGDRMLLHWRFDMLQFYDKHHPKYFLVCHRLLSAINGAVPPRLQHALRWNRTVNPHGGKGKNIAMDLQMEFFNKDYKESVKDAAGQLTPDTIARHSEMVGIRKELEKVYSVNVSGTSGRLVHGTGCVSRKKDIKEFVSLLTEEDLFTFHTKRRHASFQSIGYQPYPNLVSKTFKARLVRLRKEMSKRIKLLHMNRNDTEN